MNQPASLPAIKPKRAVRTVVRAGLMAGTLDITAAIVHYLASGGKSAVAVLNFIASGVFGKDAFVGGVSMAMWGLVFHYITALTFALFFFLIYPKVRGLITNRIVTGLLYGLFVWVVMNLIVLPMSNAPALPFTLFKAILNVAILMVAVGLPISLIVSRYFSDK